MHHPDICNVVRIIDDYFLIAFPDSSSTIKGKKLDWGSEDSLVISRELRNGRLEIQIDGEDKDDDSINVVYYQQGSTNVFDKKLEIGSDDFTLTKLRKAIRELVIYDATTLDAEKHEKSVDNWLKD
jgi:hypothetical protein